MNSSIYYRLIAIGWTSLLVNFVAAQDDVATEALDGIFSKISKPSENTVLTLRERAEIDGEGNGSGPSRFSATAPRDGDAVYSFDGALILKWSPAPQDIGPLEIVSWDIISVDAHLSSDQNQDERSLTLRTGGNFLLHLWEGGGFYGNLGGFYEADQSFKDQGAGVSLRLTPVDARIPGLGRARSLIPNLLSIEWRPWLGVDLVAPIRSASGRAENMSGRYYALARVDLTLDKIPWFRVYVQYKGYLLVPDGSASSEAHSFVQVGANLKFSKNVSLEGGYKNGELSPNLSKHLDLFFAGLAVHF